MDKKVTSPLIVGVVISLVLIVLDLVAGFANFKFATWYRWIPVIVMCVAIIIACINYSNQKDNFVTFGNVFGFGFKTSAILAGFMLVYTLLSLYLIFPDTEEKYLVEMRREMENNPGMSEEQVDQAVTMTSKFFLVGAVISATVGTLFFGTIASLLGGAFAKKKPVSPFNQPAP